RECTERAQLRLRPKNIAHGRAVRCARRADAPSARRQGAADPAGTQTNHIADHAQYHRGGAALGPHYRDDLSPGAGEARRHPLPAAPPPLGNHLERRLRSLRGANRERPARGGDARHAGRGSAFAARRSRTVTRVRRLGARLAAPALGLTTLSIAITLVQVLIEAGHINRFIVPLPTEIAASFGRVIAEEHVLARFLLTAGEALAAGVLLTVVGIGIGVLLYRFRLLRLACETWVAALASAPLVLMYPLFLVIFGRSAMTMVMMGFVAALPPVILKTVEGLAGT